MADEPLFKLSDVKKFVSQMFSPNPQMRAESYPVPDYTRQPPAPAHVGYTTDAPWEAPQAMQAPQATSHSPLQQIAALRALQAQIGTSPAVPRTSLYHAADVGGSYADKLKDLNFWDNPTKNFS